MEKSLYPSGTPLKQSPKKPHLILRPGSGWQALDLGELWQFRDLLIALARRDIKLRYRQTVLGVIWVILQPLLSAAIFSLVFGRIARLPSEGVPYFIFAYAGMLVWNLFNNIVMKSSGCLIENKHLVSKVFFPRLLLPLPTVFSSLLDFGVSLSLLAVMLPFYGIFPGVGLLLLPLLLLLLIMLALGIGAYAAALTASYRDVQHALPVLWNLLLYASPVLYTVSIVPAQLKGAYLLNPLAGILEAFRWSLLNRGEFKGGALATAAAISLIVFIAGLFAFKRMERSFVDVI